MTKLSEEVTFRLMTFEIIQDVLSEADHPDVTLFEMCDRFREITGAKLIMLFDHKKSKKGVESNLVSVNPDRKKHISQEPVISILIDKCYKQKDILLIDDKNNAEEFIALKKLGFDLSIIVPLILNDITIGSIQLFGLPERVNIELIINGLYELTKTVGLLLRFSALYKNMEHLVAERTSQLLSSNNRLNLISQIIEGRIDKFTVEEQATKLLGQVKEVFNVDACVVRTLHENNLVLTASIGIKKDSLPEAFPLDSGFLKEIVEDLNPISVMDVGNWSQLIATGSYDLKAYKSLAAAPLVLEGELVGLISVSTLYEKREFTKLDLDHLQIVANQIAVAIENARLFRQNEIQRQNLTKEIESRKKAEEQLRQAQKMEAIGTLAGGIAHDFNNILGVIMGYTELSIDEIPGDHMLTENLQHIMRASLRAKEMVTQILAFSRKSEETMKPLNIEKILLETINFLRSTIPSTINIKHSINEKTGLIIGNATQINQVVMNLCTNAAHSMKKGSGEIELILDKVIVDYDDTLLDIKSGEYQTLSIIDTGSGMDKKTLDRIFEPYFTTKDTGEGTGLGLAVVYGIVKGHGGEIKVYSEPGIGTTFTLYFPLIENVEKVSSPSTEVLDLMGNGEYVLLVDDEVSLAEVGSTMLKKLGYNVEVKSSSLEALECFNAKPDKFDIIVTDMTMPHMTGIQLADEIHKIKPDIPVILCTGYSKEINRDVLKLKGINVLVMKPIIKAKIGKALKEILKN